MRVWVPDPKNPDNEIKVPVFEGVCINDRPSEANLLMVVVRKDRPICGAILKRMKECFFAWLHWHCILNRGYTEEVSRKLLDGLGPGFYYTGPRRAALSIP